MKEEKNKKKHQTEMLKVLPCPEIQFRGVQSPTYLGVGDGMRLMLLLTLSLSLGECGVGVGVCVRARVCRMSLCGAGWQRS